MTVKNPIPVICDRCGAEGLAGEGDFAGLGDLLDFDPVPRKIERVDGWTPECQRGYIAALAVTGSPRRAAKAVGKSAFGAEQLRKAAGAESFSTAWDAAMAVSAENSRRRLADSLGAVIGRAAPPGRPRPAPDPEPEPDDADLSPQERAKLEALDGLCRHYLKRLGMEREARLAGKVVEADFYVRQVTVIEVWLDLLSDDAWRLLNDLRLDNAPFGRFRLIEVAETPMSRLLDEARREQWAEAGEPERPPLPPAEQLIDHGRFSIDIQESFHGGPDLKERMRAKDAEYRAAARAQVEWEAEARRDFERRRDSAAAQNQEPRPAGQPAPPGDRTDVTNSVRDGPVPDRTSTGAAPPEEERQA